MYVYYFAHVHRAYSSWQLLASTNDMVTLSTDSVKRSDLTPKFRIADGNTRVHVVEKE